MKPLFPILAVCAAVVGCSGNDAERLEKIETRLAVLEDRVSTDIDGRLQKLRLELAGANGRLDELSSMPPPTKFKRLEVAELLIANGTDPSTVILPGKVIAVNGRNGAALCADRVELQHDNQRRAMLLAGDGMPILMVWDEDGEIHWSSPLPKE